MLTNVVQVMLVSLGLCLPSATASDVSLFGTVVLIRSKIKLCSGRREYVVLSGFK